MSEGGREGEREGGEEGGREGGRVFSLPPHHSIFVQLLAVVYSNFAEEEKDKFRKLFLHKREALRHAFRVLTGPTGITFHDFLVFMQHYRPRIREWEGGREGGRVSAGP